MYRLIALDPAFIAPDMAFDTAQAAIAYATAQGMKARPEIIVDDSWIVREFKRLESGEHEALPWAQTVWFERQHSAAHPLFAHVCKRDPSKVAFTESPEKGMRDIQTVTTPGRFLERYYSAILDSEQIRDIARAYATRHEIPTLQIARLSSEIVTVYRNGPSSCMSHSVDSYSGDEHPCTVYGYETADETNETALTLAYIKQDSRITARALINEARKVHMRLYGDCDLLRKALHANGYHAADPIGFSVRAIENGNGSGYIMPYIDAGESSSYGAANVTQSGSRFVISKGGYCAGNTNGTLLADDEDEDEDEDSNYCEYYDESTNDEVYCVIVDQGGRTEWWSESAIDNHATRIGGEYYSDELVSTDGNGHEFLSHVDSHTYCEETCEYWPNDEMKRCEESDEYFHESVCTEVSIETGTVWIADKHLDSATFTCLISETVWHNDSRHADYLGVASIHDPDESTGAGRRLKGLTMTRETKAMSKSETAWRALIATPGARDLVEMLTYARPAWSATEESFIARFIDSVPGMASDSFGNRYIAIGAAPVTLWSSHTDSVHRTEGRQELIRTHGHVIMRKDGKQCLGADCATGVWLMLEMIAASIPGLYVFHRDEESGGRGSRFIATKTPHMLDGIRHAIAFDRKGESSVITHQSGGRCCSDTFANALANALGEGWKGDDGGTFTDTANYVDLVPECTNVSVGYRAQHTGNETQSMPFALALRDTLISRDWSDLPCERDPVATYDAPFTFADDEELRDAIWAEPSAVADFLLDQGFTMDDLRPYTPRRKRK